ncbi:restriction endonuclease subunit S [Spiribacter curvatus]|nr:restriction endonuclease subunit S [Spiribacter curvatus]
MRFGDFVDLNPKVKMTKGERYAFVEMKDLEPWVRTVSSKYNKEFSGSGSKFESGDTLLARVTPCLENGKTSQFNGHSLPAWGSTEFIVLRAIPEKSDKSFIYYFSRSPGFRSYAIQNMVGSSGRQRVPNDAIKTYECEFPPIFDQKAIAHILGTLDDKIELNQKMNQTLEEIAKAIFKSWFVDFDPVRAKADGRPTGLPSEISDLFPDELVDSEIGEIPEAWQPTTLSNVTSVIGRGVTPKYSDEGVTILNQKCIRNGSISPNLARSTSTDKKYKKEKFLKKYDCVINSTGVGTLGRVAICDSSHLGMLCDSHVSIVRGVTPEMSIFLSMHLSLMEREIENLGHGSTGQIELSRTAIGDIGVTIPSTELLKKTESLLSSFIERRRLNDLESETLSELRDALLPKLISGELRIPDAEKFLEEAGV